MKFHIRFALPNRSTSQSAGDVLSSFYKGMAESSQIVNPKSTERKVAKSPHLAAPYGTSFDPLGASGGIKPGKLVLVGSGIGVGQSTRPVFDHQVVLHNNSRTPFENVVQTLQAAFGLDYDEARKIMYDAHNQGPNGRAPVSVVPVTKEQAQEQAALAMKVASGLKNKRGSTLRFSVRKL